MPSYQFGSLGKKKPGLFDLITLHCTKFSYFSIKISLSITCVIHLGLEKFLVDFQCP